jgi:hypothetical protein
LYRRKKSKLLITSSSEDLHPKPELEVRGPSQMPKPRYEMDTERSTQRYELR